MEMSYPEGATVSTHIVGRARDIFTPVAGQPPEVLAEDSLTAILAANKTIAALASDPPLPADIDLVGTSALAGFRRAIAPVVDRPGYRDRPLALILDDIVGVAVIAGWGKYKLEGFQATPELMSQMNNVCVGHSVNSPEWRTNREGEDIAVPRLQPADDPHAFHALADDVLGMARRVRRIDLWRTADGFAMDAMFHDSGVELDGIRKAIHEYRVFAKAAEEDGRLILTGLEMVPGDLPFSSCLRAPLTTDRLYGLPLTDLRQHVLKELRGPLGCTHLNDAIRSLAMAPALAPLCPG